MAPHFAVFLTVILAVDSLAADVLHVQDAAVAIDATPPVAGSATKAIMVVQAPLKGSAIVLSTDADGNLVLTAAASGAGSPAQAPALAPDASLSQSLPVPAPQAVGNAFAQAATALPASPSPRPASPAAAASPAQAPASAAHSLAAAFPLPHIVPAPASVPSATAQYDEHVLGMPTAAQPASDYVAPELLSAPAQAPAVPRATVRRAAATEAALSALRANTAKALASALSGKALGGIVNGTAGALSGSLPIDPITAVIEAGRNSTGSAVSAPLVHPLRVFRPLNLLAPPNTTEPLNFVGNVLEDRVAESASELVDAIEQGTASSRKAVKAVIG